MFVQHLHVFIHTIDLITLAYQLNMFYNFSCPTTAKLGEDDKKMILSIPARKRKAADV